MNIYFMKELLLLLPIVTISILMAIFLVKRKKKEQAVVPAVKAPIRTVITEAIVPERIVLEYKHHRRVEHAPEQDAVVEDFLQHGGMYEQEFEDWDSPFIATPFSKN